jgi:hypothetical protein
MTEVQSQLGMKQTQFDVQREQIAQLRQILDSQKLQLHAKQQQRDEEILQEQRRTQEGESERQALTEAVARLEQALRDRDERIEENLKVIELRSQEVKDTEANVNDLKEQKMKEVQERLREVGALKYNLERQGKEIEELNAAIERMKAVDIVQKKKFHQKEDNARALEGNLRSLIQKHEEKIELQRIQIEDQQLHIGTFFVCFFFLLLDEECCIFIFLSLVRRHQYIESLGEIAQQKQLVEQQRQQQQLSMQKELGVQIEMQATEIAQLKSTLSILEESDRNRQENELKTRYVILSFLPSFFISLFLSFIHSLMLVIYISDLWK